MKDYYEEDLTEEDYYAALQRRIDDGSIWRFEGSAGRAAMDALRAGACMLGEVSHRDYYGNRIPSRYEVKDGTTGSISLHKRYLEEVN